MSAPTVTMISQSSTGSHPASARRPTTSPNPIPKKSAVVHGTRSQPGARTLRQPVGGGAGGACTACSKTSVTARSPYPARPQRSPFDLIQRSNAGFSSTTTGARMSAWPSPQSSVQMRVCLPDFVGVMPRRVSTPGTASCFWRNSGTQNEWITSSDRSLSSTCRSSWSQSVPDSNPPYCGYLKLQANRRAVRVVVRTGSELHDRVDADRGHDREDGDADGDHEPEDEVDSLAFLRVLIRQPVNEDRHRGRSRGCEETDRDDPDNCSSAHRTRAYSTFRCHAVVSVGPQRGRREETRRFNWDLEQVCF